jgi:hypothetical protein
MAELDLIEATPKWLIRVYYSGSTPGDYFRKFIEASKMTGETPLGAYAVTLRDYTWSPHSNTLDGFVVTEA